MSLLEFAFELVTAPVDGGKVVMSELAPLLFGNCHRYCLPPGF